MVIISYVVTRIISIFFSGVNLVFTLLEGISIADLLSDDLSPVDFVRRINKFVTHHSDK